MQGNNDKIDELQQSFIQQRRNIEKLLEEARIEQEQHSGIILHPQPKDVLVGRGRPYQEFPGNQRLGVFVEQNVDRVKDVKDRYEKTNIFLEVVKKVKATGGRFISKTSEGWWKVTSDKTAREKTCSAFRSKMGKTGKQPKNASSSGANINTMTVDDILSSMSDDDDISNTFDMTDMAIASMAERDLCTKEHRDSKRMKYDPSVI